MIIKYIVCIVYKFCGLGFKIVIIIIMIFFFDNLVSNFIVYNLVFYVN